MNPNPPNFIEMWNRFQVEQASQKAATNANDSELNEAWANWDGTSLIHIGGVYVGELDLVIEMQKRGLECCF